MITKQGPLSADDGAYLLVELAQRDRQVIVRMKVCLDLTDRQLSEPPRSQICTTLNVARDFALEVATARSLPVIWEGAEFIANVMYVGGHWQGAWAIRFGAFVLDSDITNYRSEDTARVMVKADARNHGYGRRVKWEDGYAEPALA